MGREYKDYTEGIRDRSLQIKIMDKEGEIQTQISQFRKVPPELADKFIDELETMIETLNKDSFQEMQQDS